MRMGRHFIALLPEGLQDNVEIKQVMVKFRRTASERTREVRWMDPALWHVAVLFLGDIGVASERLKLEVIQKLPLPGPDFKLRLHGFGAFPSPREARSLWIGVQETQPLLDYQQTLAGILDENSIALGDKSIRPHLPLARFRNSVHVEDLIKLGGRKHFGDYAARELILLESVLQGNIIKYVPVLRRNAN